MKLKKANQHGRNSTESSKPPGYLDAVYGDAEVVQAWQRVSDRYRELLPDLADEPLDPRGDPRRWFGRVEIEDPELSAAEATFNAARRAAMQRFAHLRGAR